MTACDSDETGLVIFAAQKAKNRCLRRRKEEKWELFAEGIYVVTISSGFEEK